MNENVDLCKILFYWLPTRKKTRNNIKAVWMKHKQWTNENQHNHIYLCDKRKQHLMDVHFTLETKVAVSNFLSFLFSSNPYFTSWISATSVLCIVILGQENQQVFMFLSNYIGVDWVFIGSEITEIPVCLSLLGRSLAGRVLLVIDSNDTSLTYTDLGGVKWLTFERWTLCIPCALKDVLYLLMGEKYNKVVDNEWGFFL